MSIATAKRVLQIESEAIVSLVDRIGEAFERAEEIIAGVRGRVIVSGLGKSGIIGRKIASTLASIGVPAFYLHPVESAHGDLGMVMRGDVALLISKSGATDELATLVAHLKRLDIPIIALTGSPSSPLAGFADVVLDVSVECEACPLNIVPTASTTAALAVGDALAVSLLERKGLSAEDFAVLHPGGAIGKKLTYRVRDLMISAENLPLVDAGASMREVVEVMSATRHGIAVITSEGKLTGVITDGDIRRLLQRVDHPLEVSAGEAFDITGREGEPRRAPVTVKPDAFVARAVNLMEQHRITALVAADADGAPMGLIRWLDLSQAGVV